LNSTAELRAEIACGVLYTTIDYVKI